MGIMKSVLGASWLCALACGGISERQASDETGGATSGGSTSHPPVSGGSSSHRPGSNASGGSAPAVGGVAAGGAPAVGGVAAGGAPVVVAGAPTNGGDTMAGHMDSGVACYNDIDCPVDACGAEVCNWTKIAVTPIGMRTFACNAAGSQPLYMDGWCTTDADCKCRGLGAKCIAPYCSFTRVYAPGR